MSNPPAVKQHWEDPQTVSLRDENLRLLEQRTISIHLEPVESLLEMGCGDCINTRVYSGHAKTTWAIDYSTEMIKKARSRMERETLPRTHLINGDFFLLKALRKKFQTIVSQRCLINLSGWTEQQEAISTIAEKLDDRGMFLMLETTLDGLENLNRLRNRVGLPSIPQTWHNQNFDLQRLLDFLGRYFLIEAMTDFSFYFLITRVLNPLLGLPADHPQSKKLDEVARELAEKIGPLGIEGIGPQMFFKLRKRS
jgi:hypothetical protein